MSESGAEHLRDVLTKRRDGYQQNIDGARSKLVAINEEQARLTTLIDKWSGAIEEDEDLINSISNSAADGSPPPDFREPLADAPPVPIQEKRVSRQQRRETARQAAKPVEVGLPEAADSG